MAHDPRNTEAGFRLPQYLWPTVAVAAATLCLWLARADLDRGQAALLYLPIVLACAIRYGFGSACLATGLGFLCWDYFLLPPFYTLKVANPRDWLSLIVFLLAAVMTARLAAQARAQTRRAQKREAEIATLFQASETISREVRTDPLLQALTQQLQSLCRATRCSVLRRDALGSGLSLVESARDNSSESLPARILDLAQEAAAQDRIVGLESGGATAEGAFLPLRATEGVVGVLHVGPRENGRAYSQAEQRILLTLANHVAVVLARDILTERAAEAAALKEADAVKDSLLSLVSHELQTPLAAIKASASGLLQTDADWEEADRLEAIGAINSEADRLSRLVRNLLDLSRLEAGAWTPQKDWCDVGEVAGTALDRLPPEEAARVVLTMAGALPLIRADYTQLALVLTNILENAVKYTPPGSPILLDIQPGFARDERSDSGVTIHVQDYGPGLVSGEEQHLFERFYRGRRHADSAVHGTGLGLALCAAVVHAHGGHIHAHSAAERGSTGAVFCVSLPRE